MSNITQKMSEILHHSHPLQQLQIQLMKHITKKVQRPELDLKIYYKGQN